MFKYLFLLPVRSRWTDLFTSVFGFNAILLIKNVPVFVIQQSNKTNSQRVSYLIMTFWKVLELSDEMFNLQFIFNVNLLRSDMTFGRFISSVSFEWILANVLHLKPVKQNIHCVFGCFVPRVDHSSTVWMSFTPSYKPSAMMMMMWWWRPWWWCLFLFIFITCFSRWDRVLFSVKNKNNKCWRQPAWRVWFTVCWRTNHTKEQFDCLGTFDHKIHRNFMRNKRQYFCEILTKSTAAVTPVEPLTLFISTRESTYI